MLNDSAISELGNVSTRGYVGTGDDVLIGGFIVEGTAPKEVLVRALGPTLAGLGVEGALTDPQILLTTVEGQPLASNDDWRSTQEAAIAATGFAPPDDSEPAVLITLDPGAYTPIVSGVGDGTGVGIVEVYDVEDSMLSELRNVSTRGYVGTGDDVLIGGFIVEGQSPKTVLVRALGPTLTALGVEGALRDPELLLTTVAGVHLADNDDWRTGGQEELIAVTGYAPSNDLEPAIVITLDPGAYTPIVYGSGGGTGVGIVEVYTIDTLSR
jgi:hypothetical protein